MGDAASSSSAAPEMAKLSQQRYERALLGEINKLQEALHEERKMIAAQKAQMTAEKTAERERRANESEKASRLQAMEAAILQAQKEEEREFNRKRQAADKRMQEREQAAAKQRTMEAKRQEQQRQLAAKLHQETMERAAEERRQAEESKRLADERKERKLHERLAAERVELEERNLRKAEEAEEKVLRAAHQRVEMTNAQRSAYQRRMEAQAARAAELKASADRRTAEIRAAGEMKRQVIQRTQQQQQLLEEKRRSAILQAEADKQARLDARSAAEAEARQALQHERVLQQAASRGRVERTMGDLQAQLSALEGQLDVRNDKLDSFTLERSARFSESRRLSIASALERASLANSMNKMRSNLTNKSTIYLELPPERRHVESRELKALLDRVDPDCDGHISLTSMKKTLNKLLPPVHAADLRSPKKAQSQSLPSLLTLEQKKMSQYDQFVAAFRAVDTDGSGTISKRELYEVLRTSGLTNGKVALEVFQGFDENSDGQLDFDEFQRIAKMLC